MTEVTNCQGLQLDPDLAYSKSHQFPSSITVENTNVDVSCNPYRKEANGYTWWLTYGLTCISGPIALSNDYFSGPPADLAAASVWSYPGCGAQNSHGVISWTASMSRASSVTGHPQAAISSLSAPLVLATAHRDIKDRSAAWAQPSRPYGRQRLSTAGSLRTVLVNLGDHADRTAASAHWVQATWRCSRLF
jgi:hypothetical protein